MREDAQKGSTAFQEGKTLKQTKLVKVGCGYNGKPYSVHFAALAAQVVRAFEE